MIGITGTKGKTTTTYLLKSICEKAGLKCGIIGSTGTVVEEQHLDSKLTTPDPIDLQKMLNLSQDSVLELIHKEKFLTMTFEGKFWIPKVIFDDWYASQSRYRKSEDRERDRAAEESSMTIPEMGRLLGLNPRQAWQLYYKHQDELKLIRIADRPRVTNASFLYWISGQEEHKIDSEATLPQTESEDELLTALEAAEKLGVNVQRIYRALRNSKAAGKKVGRTWYFKYMDILTALSKEE